MDYLFSFFAGFLGSLHCVGMCGAIVLAYSSQGAASLRTSAGILSHLVYNSGRIVSYTMIGGLAGFLGRMAGSLQTIGSWFSLFAGGLMVLAGFFMLRILPGVNAWERGEGTLLRKAHVRAVANLLNLRTLESTLYIGLLTPLLPCGLLYSMFVKAAATGSAEGGALTMLAFGTGILPALFVTGIVSSFVGVKLRFYANRLAAATVILMGIVIILRGAGVPLPFMGAMHGSHEPRQSPIHQHQRP